MPDFKGKIKACKMACCRKRQTLNLNLTRTNKMQKNTSKPFDYDKKQICIRQYEAPPPLAGGKWNQLHDQARNRQQSRQMTKADKSGKPQRL